MSRWQPPSSSPRRRESGMTELLNTLYVQTPGASLYLEGDSVRVVIPDDPQRRTLPLRRLESIVAFGNIQVSAHLLSRCAADGRPVVWMTPGGRFLGRMDGPTRGNVLLRHAQHIAHADAAARLAIARACVAGKIQNSRQIILRGARDVNGGRQELRDRGEDLACSLDGTKDAPHLDVLLGVEGQAARTYSGALGLLLRGDLDLMKFSGRVKRPATDPVNALLSFLYGLLRSAVHVAAEQVGPGN